MAIWKLTIEDDEGQKTVVPLVRDEYTIGRKDGHTIRLTERNISRDHAKLRKQAEAYVLEDLGSYNGVFVNGHRVADPVTLASGDLILLGDYRIEAHNEDVAQRVVAQAVPALAAKAPSQHPPIARSSTAPASSKPNRLVLLTGVDGGKEFPLDKASVLLGRGDDVDVRVNHSSVSRHHCELRARDDGRFDVLDRGSANGLRVNGEDVKKGLLGVGDVLELGDVQLKFVGAGQLYVFDAAAAEAARAHEVAGDKRRRRAGAGTWVIVVVLVGLAAAGGVMLAKSSHDDVATGSSSSGTPTQTTSTNTAASTATMASTDDLLARALKLMESDPTGAHELVKTASATQRADSRFVEIENAWADVVLRDLGGDPDESSRRDKLVSVRDSGADDARRQRAIKLLDQITLPTADDGGAVASATTAPSIKPSTTTTKPSTTTTAVTTKPTTTTTAVTTKPTTTTTAVTTKPSATATTPTVGDCASYKGDYGGAMTKSDYVCVKAMLYPRLGAGAISSTEARYLKAACQAIGDMTCVKRAAEKI